MSGVQMGAAMMQGAVISGGEALCEPITTYKTVMESKYVTESRSVRS